MRFSERDCIHPKISSVAVVVRDENGTPYSVVVTAACLVCRMPFEFVGIETTSTIMVSGDRREVHLLITEARDQA
ncbi:hypothetical protein DYQ86_15950 [Acidobacteria bacterium AB60]|nr:hypothetical protein DYQ86_15950 [Acidobacteria bacterium AB60]